MSADTRINRTIAGLVIVVVIVILIIALGITLIARADEKEQPPQIGQRSPVESLTYCNNDQGKLCVISFNQNDEGQMLVNFSTPNPYYPEIILKVSLNGQESTYECERGKEPAASMICKGAMQVPGQVMQFTVISRNWGNLLAEGKFAIIGIALATPENIPTVTIEGLTEVPSETSTATAVFLLPTSTTMPTPTTSTPSYPNPSYPNPSYP